MGQSTSKKPPAKKAESSSTKENKQAQEAPETARFALECALVTSKDKKVYFVLSTKMAYFTDGKQEVRHPVLQITSDDMYVFSDSMTYSGSTFDYEMQVNRQNLGLLVFTDMRGDTKKTYSFTTKYSCVQVDSESTLAVVKEATARQAAAEAEKKKEMINNQKL